MYLLLTFPHLIPKIFIQWFKHFFSPFIYNATLTSPSILYHSLYDMRLRSISPPRHNYLPPNKHDIILCLHGRGGHPSDFQYLIDKLEPETNAKFLAFHIKNSNTLISEDVEAIKLNLKPLMDQIKSITILGLSKGGLTAIKFALDCDLVTKIITISSPLNGTCIANNYPFCANTRKELAYNSESTQRLKEESKHLNIYSIVPKYDHMIIPTESSYYPHSKIYFYNGYYSHAGILYAPQVIDKIKEWI